MFIYKALYLFLHTLSLVIVKICQNKAKWVMSLSGNTNKAQNYSQVHSIVLSFIRNFVI